MSELSLFGWCESESLFLNPKSSPFLFLPFYMLAFLYAVTFTAFPGPYEIVLFCLKFHFYFVPN